MATRTDTRSRGGPSGPVLGGSKNLIAVDFGTTFSAVAWANTNEPQNQHLITDWGRGLTGQKVPTILQYANDGVKWGWELQDLEPDTKIHEWFKLGLCPEVEDQRATESSLLRDFPSKTALPPVRGKRCRQLVVDYLKKVKEATERHLIPYNNNKFYELPREYIITVPAMWSEEAQDATRAYAAEAFLGDPNKVDEIQIIAEPEAAGIYALTSMPKLGMKEGDTFVICDAGGGTVDLSSYRVTNWGEYIDLDRVSTPSGGVCGSSLLNRIFEAYLEKKIGLNYEALEEWQQRWFKSAVNENFEKRIKPTFTGEDRNYNIDAFGFGDSTDSGIRNNRLSITAEELRREVFDKVISRITDLVVQKVNDTGNVKEVLLAGGFGENDYLKSRIEIAVGGRIGVRRIENSRVAIVQGALIARLTERGQLEHRRRPPRHQDNGSTQPDDVDNGRIYPRVVGRPAPKHYGILVNEEYDDTNTIHRRGYKRRNKGSDGRPDTIDRFEWFAKMGEKYPDNRAEPFSYSFEKEALPGVPRPKTLSCEVYSSGSPEPPEFPEHPGFRSVSSAQPLLTLEIDLDRIPNWRPTRRANNRSYWCLDFEVYMMLHSANLSFYLGLGKETYAPKSVTYRSQSAHQS